MCVQRKSSSLICILLASLWSNVFAIELFYLKGSDDFDADSFGNKYAFILPGRNESYGFIIKCNNVKQEKDVLSALFNNPHPAVDKKNQFTYSDFESAKQMNAKTFIKLCPYDEKSNGINLFKDTTTYFLHFYDAFDESLYLTVKSKKILKSFGLDYSNVKKVPQKDFKKYDVVVLDDSIEASNYHIDQTNKEVKIYVDIDETFKADVEVKVHLKGKRNKNERFETIDILKDQYIFESNFYICNSNSDTSNDSSCELNVPYGQMINKLNRQLGDDFEVDEIEDISFENAILIERKEAARIFYSKKLEKERHEKEIKEIAEQEQSRLKILEQEKIDLERLARKSQKKIDQEKLFQERLTQEKLAIEKEALRKLELEKQKRLEREKEKREIEDSIERELQYEKELGFEGPIGTRSKSRK